ncbi:MAG TPA: glycosyltransferase family 2 protein [Terriglobales bacterium]|nr:glycosyltransferase family 2 protein [Terriglobales bacterium]
MGKAAVQPALDGSAAIPLRTATPYLAESLLFRLVLSLLILVVFSAFVLKGVTAWSIGLTYIAYDSWLLWYMVRSSRRSVDLLREPELLGTDLPQISVLVAAYNEHLVLPDCIGALRRQTDPPDEIIIVDDGSSDDSIAHVAAEFQVQFPLGKAAAPQIGVSVLDARLKVLKKGHSGKADSMNQAWPQAQFPLIVTIDADTVLDPGAIAAVRRAFGANKDLAAGCGVLTPKCRNVFWGRFFEFYQSFEYYRAFLWRLSWTSSDSLLLVSGAFAAYRKNVLQKLGGFDAQSLVEDYELIYRLHRYAGEHGEKMQVQVIGGARAVTDAPASIRSFLNQRARWFSGFLQTLSRNCDMVGDKRFGRVGGFMLPIKTVDTLLPIYAVMAAAVLGVLIIAGGKIDPAILLILAIKLLVDLVFHCHAIWTYQRWQGLSSGNGLWAKSVIATLTEPFVFQLLRHTGAILGWIAFLRKRAQWVPQRG